MRSSTLALAAALVMATLGATVASAGPEDTAQSHIAAGATASDKKDYDSAIREFTKAIALDPNRDESYHRRAVAYANKGDFDKSLADMTKVIELEAAGRKSSSFVERGEVYLMKRDPDAAIADFDRAIALDPKYAYAYRRRSRAWSVKGDDTKALADCCQAIRLTPDDDEYYRERGRILQRMGDNVAALKDFDKAVALRDDPEQLYCRGQFLVATGEYRKAIDDLLRAIDPVTGWDVFDSVCDLLRTAYVKAGLLDEGVADLTATIDELGRLFGPDFNAAFHLPSLLYTRSQLYRAKRAFALAVADLSALIAANPKIAGNYSERGDVYREMGDLAKAAADYTRVLELDRRNASAYYRRACVRDEQGDADGARADYTSAIGLDPTSPSVYLRRGWLMDCRGDFEGAVADYRRAAELDPRDDMSRHLLGVATFSHGGARESIAAFRAAIAIAPDYAVARDFLFLARAFCGERTEAAAELRAYFATLSPADRDEWEITVARCLVGDTTADELLAAAEASPAARRDRNRCAALFYVGALQLLDGKEDAAKASFARAAATGEERWQEKNSAAALLKAMPKPAPLPTRDVPTDSPFTWTVPDGWTASEPASAMRLMQFDVGVGEGGEAIVCAVFGRIGGEDDTNVARWIDQMGVGADGNAKKATSVKDGVTVVRLEVRGTYIDSQRTLGEKTIAPATLLAAIVTGPGGKLHVKLVGPSAIVDAQAAKFDAWIASMKPR